MIKRIAFTGKMGSGKTTAAQYLVQRYGFTKLSFADPIRRLAREIFDDVKNDERRQFMQMIGNGGRSVNQNIWLRPVERWLKEHPHANVVIDDVRFRNELDFCQKHGFAVYRIESENRMDRLAARDGFIPSDESLADVSETALDHVQLPVICNNGELSEFYCLLDQVVLDQVVKQLETEGLHCGAILAG